MTRGGGISGISACIPTFNSARKILETLEAVEAASIRLPPSIPSELIVIGNACTDDTEDVVLKHWAKQHSGPARRFLNESRAGAAWARLKGYGSAKYDVIVFCDDDVVPAPDSLQLVAETAESEEEVGGGAGRILASFPPGVSWPVWMDDQLKSNFAVSSYPRTIYNPPEGFLPPSAFVWFRKVSLRGWAASIPKQRFILGPSANGMWRGEDQEMDLILLRDRWKLKHDPRIVAHHKIPEERLESGYAAKLMYWNGRSAQRLRHRFSRWSWLSALAYCAYKTARIDRDFLRRLGTYGSHPNLPCLPQDPREINRQLHLLYQEGRAHEIIAKAINPFRQ